SEDPAVVPMSVTQPSPVLTPGEDHRVIRVQGSRRVESSIAFRYGSGKDASSDWKGTGPGQHARRPGSLVRATLEAEGPIAQAP
ncbi:MAG: hypothetical protein AAFR40_18260, partial [Pseudomonadota bacterium]